MTSTARRRSRYVVDPPRRGMGYIAAGDYDECMNFASAGGLTVWDWFGITNPVQLVGLPPGATVYVAQSCSGALKKELQRRSAAGKIRLLSVRFLVEMGRDMPGWRTVAGTGNAPGDGPP